MLRPSARARSARTDVRRSPRELHHDLLKEQARLASSCAAAMRERRLRARDELEQRRAAFFVLLARAQYRVADFGRTVPPLAPAAEVLRDIRVVPAEIARPMLLV